MHLHLQVFLVDDEIRIQGLKNLETQKLYKFIKMLTGKQLAA